MHVLYMPSYERCDEIVMREKGSDDDCGRRRWLILTDTYDTCMCDACLHIVSIDDTRARAENNRICGVCVKERKILANETRMCLSTDE